MDTGEGDQVSLELVKIDVKGTVKAERRCDRGNDLSDEAVEVGEAGLGDAETLLADIVDGLVVNLCKRP